MHGQTAMRDAQRQSPVSSANEAIWAYLTSQNVEEYGWENPEGDRHFQLQRQKADQSDASTARFFFELMIGIADEMNKKTNAFCLDHANGIPKILDTCTAPGGFVEWICRHNQHISVEAFSLPPESGGHVIQIQRQEVKVISADITMFAADMGATAADVPRDHPDTENLLMERIFGEDRFDLALCDGQVLRTHPLAPYRQHREARRLTTSQLILGLEHMRPGGTLIILLHKLEAFETAKLLCDFSKFSEVTIFKPRRAHASRSSFYMIAKKIRSTDRLALDAVAELKKMWLVSTFGTDEEYKKATLRTSEDGQRLMDDFGEELISMGRKIWNIQASSLAKKSWTQ